MYLHNQYIYTYIYIYRERERDRDRQTERERERVNERKANKQTEGKEEDREGCRVMLLF